MYGAPGSIGQLDDVELDVPPHLNRATALIALALFTGDISYYLTGRREAANFIAAETAAKPMTADQLTI